MNRLILFCGILFLGGCDTSSNISSPDKGYFTKFFGGDGDQFGVDMVVDSDGSIFILGNSVRESLPQQVYLAKANSTGLVVWEKYLGDKPLDAKDLELTKAGELILVANKQTTSDDMDILIRRFSKDGVEIDSTVLWSKELGQSNSVNSFKNDYANSITELKNGGFVVIGYTDNVSAPNHIFDILNIQIDNSFNKMNYSYNETNGSGTKNKGAKLLENRNSLYLFGSSNFANPPSLPHYHAWTCSLSNEGTGTYNTDNLEFSISESEESVTNAVKSFVGYGIVSVSSYDGIDTLRVIKIPGDSLWFTSHDKGPVKQIPLGSGIDLSANICNGFGLSGFFVVASYYTASSPTSDILLIKLDDDLNEVWSQPIQFGGSGDDSAAAVSQLADGRILVLGTMQLGNPSNQHKIALIKVNSSGKLQE